MAGPRTLLPSVVSERMQAPERNPKDLGRHGVLESPGTVEKQMTTQRSFATGAQGPLQEVTERRPGLAIDAYPLGRLLLLRCFGDVEGIVTAPVLPQAHREAGAGAPRRVRGGLLRVPEEGDDGTGQRLPWDCSQHLRAAPEPRGASRRSRDATDGPDAFRPRRRGSVGGLFEVQSRTRPVRPSRGPGGSRRRGEARAKGPGGDRRVRPPVSGPDPRAHPHGKR